MSLLRASVPETPRKQMVFPRRGLTLNWSPNSIESSHTNLATSFAAAPLAWLDAPAKLSATLDKGPETYLDTEICH